MGYSIAFHYFGVYTVPRDVAKAIARDFAMILKQIMNAEWLARGFVLRHRAEAKA